jgi:cyclophilin family peptidyl-prolyl cis-trans isomerase
MRFSYKNNIVFVVLLIFVFSISPAYTSFGRPNMNKQNGINSLKNSSTTLTAIDDSKVAAIQINDNKSNSKKQIDIKAVVSKIPEQLKPPVKGEEIAVIRTSLGVVKIKLLPQFAPAAVEAFKARILNGYYNNLDFDKIISNSLQIGSGVQNNTEANNISTNEYNIDARNYRYAVSAAGSDQGGVAGQFTIVGGGPELIDNLQLNYMTGAGEAQFPKYVIDLYKRTGGAPFLDFHNVVFGHVFEGMGIVDSILALKVDENNKPKKLVKIKKIEIVNYKQ